MKIYYIWDAYCGWCYGFDAIFTKFVANHSDLDIEVLSGGLFVENDAKEIRNFGFFGPGSKQIGEIYGIKFGENFYKALKEGSLFVDSEIPANAFAVMRKYVDKKEYVNLTKNIHEILFLHGRDMNDVEEYIRISKDMNFYSAELEQDLRDNIKNKDLAWNDYRNAMKLNVKVFPTVIIEKDGKYFDLKGNAYTLDNLENNFKRILNFEEKDTLL